MLAVAGGKGGCGKTTTTLGLARAVDGPVLAVDADVGMPNLHALAGVDREPTLDDGQAAAQSAGEGVAVLPAPREIDPTVGLARLDGDRPVLVDCPAGASPDAVAPLQAADGAVLVSTACAASLRGAAKTAAMARAVGTPVLGVVLTRTGLAPPGVADLLDCPVLGTVPDAGPEPLATGVVADAYRAVAEACPVPGAGDSPDRGPAE